MWIPSSEQAEPDHYVSEDDNEEGVDDDEEEEDEEDLQAEDHFLDCRVGICSNSFNSIAYQIPIHTINFTNIMYKQRGIYNYFWWCLIVMAQNNFHTAFNPSF